MIRTTILMGLALLMAAPLAQAEEGAMGRWRGTYLCNQGWTGVDLEVTRDDARHEAQPDAVEGRYLKATFSFYEIERNPGVPSGRFSMRGSFNGRSGKVHLVQERWIQRPRHYVMVDLGGTLDRQTDTLKGKVTGYNCGGFELRRVDGPPKDAGSWLWGPRK